MPLTSAVTAFGIAVGVASAICYFLMTRVERLRGRGGVSGAADGGLSGNWSFTSWSGGEGGGTDGSCSFSDGSGDGGGGCDGGGSGAGD